MYSLNGSISLLEYAWKVEDSPKKFEHNSVFSITETTSFKF